MQKRNKSSRRIEVNNVLRVQAAKLSKIHADLYVWASRLRKLVAAHTRIKVPEVALSIEQGRRDRMGWYRLGRDGLQLRGRVTFNSLYLGLPECWILEVVAHEVLHFAEEIAGASSRAVRSSFHTAWFRRYARDLGFPCDQRGCGTINEIDPTSPFGMLLTKHGVKLVPLGTKRATGVVAGDGMPGLIELPPPKSTMLKWSCGCTNIRAAVEVAARCLRCGKQFERKRNPVRGRASLSSEAA